MVDMTVEQRRAIARAKAMQAQQAAAPVVQSSPMLGEYFSDLPVPGQMAAAPEPTAAPMQQESNWLGQGLSGLNEGVGNALMLPNIAEMGLRSIGPAIGNAMGGDFQYPQESYLPNMGQSFLSLANNIGTIMKPELQDRSAILPETQDSGDQISRRIGQELGASLPFIMAGGGAAANPARAIASELGIAAGSGAGAGIAQQIAPDNAIAEMVGQAAGGLGVAGLQNAARKAITPFPSNPTRENMAQILKDEGVDLTAGQRTGNTGLRYAESELGGATAQDFMEKQSEQFTQAALKKAGINANRATPEVMEEAYQTIGRAFDDMAANTVVPLDADLAKDLMTAINNYGNAVPGGMQAPAVQKFVTEISDRMNQTGALTGPEYAAFRSQMGDIARNTSSSELSGALRDIQGALDGAAERYIAKNTPELLGEWRNVRSQYRNLLTVTDAVKGAGENAAMGIISPAQLSGAIKRQNSKSWATGKGDFTDLARSGVATMSPLPNSGTASRMAVRGMTTGLPTMAGAALGGRSGDVAQALMGAAIGSQVPRAAGASMLSGPGRALIGNQAFMPSADPAMFLGPLAGGASNNEIARLLAAGQ